jgi:mono/diheme cytochrome c family protein
MTQHIVVRLIMCLAAWSGLPIAGGPLAKPLSYQLPDETAAFRPGPGLEVAQSNCAACHSAEYINYQPPQKGHAFWEAEVQKMIKAYHAPIDAEDAKTIADYLARTY